MKAVATLAAEARPCLSSKADLRKDPITGAPVLLYPEGFLELNDSAATILALCDGTLSVEGIIQQLATEFECPTEDLRADVLECLEQAHQRQLLTFPEL